MLVDTTHLTKFEYYFAYTRNGIIFLRLQSCIRFVNASQAQARCHRIGQLRAVKVYRLITGNTYEREMFDKASLKLGLDKAVLQSMGNKELSVVGAVLLFLLCYV